MFNSNNKDVNEVINKYFTSCFEMEFSCDSTKVTLNYSDFFDFIKKFNELKENEENNNKEKELLYDDLCLRYTLTRERQMFGDFPQICKERGKEKGLDIAKNRCQRDCIAFYNIAEMAVFGKEGRKIGKPR